MKLCRKTKLFFVFCFLGYSSVDQQVFHERWRNDGHANCSRLVIVIKRDIELVLFCFFLNIWTSSEQELKKKQKKWMRTIRASMPTLVVRWSTILTHSIIINWNRFKSIKSSSSSSSNEMRWSFILTTSSGLDHLIASCQVHFTGKMRRKRAIRRRKNKKKIWELERLKALHWETPSVRFFLQVVT